jgi:hypothetical protein
MCRSRQAKRMTRRSYTVLAALMLADGVWVDRDDLAALLFPWPIWKQNLLRHIRDAERFAGALIGRHRTRGYCLLALPRDEHLEGMLACVPAVKRSAWWSARDSLIRMSA